MGIPATIRVSAAATQQQRYEGELPLQPLDRIADLLADASVAVQVQLQAGTADGVPALTGAISGELPLSCRRCGATYRWPLRVTLDLRLVADEAQESGLPEAVDVVLVEDDSLSLRETVADEILLALPMLPRCESCENAVNAAPEVTATPVVETSGRENPFAALKQQLKK